VGSSLSASASGSTSTSASASASSIRTSTNPLPEARSIPSTSSSSSTISTPSTSTSTPNSTSILNSRANPSSKPRLGTAVYSALRDAVKQDGPSGLYRGLVPNLVGGASSWGLYFLL
jgi:solute carrier family 25 folate transporter 32